MTVAGEITSEDVLWATMFIEKHFLDYYLKLLASNLPDDAPNWHSVFHDAWSANLGENKYDKTLWLRREAALLVELRSAYARFIGCNPPESSIEEIFRLITEKSVKTSNSCETTGTSV